MQKKPTSMRWQNNFLSKAVEAVTVAPGTNCLSAKSFAGSQQPWRNNFMRREQEQISR